MTRFAIYGTFSSSEPGHGNLAGAEPLERVRTRPSYRLYLVDGRWPALVPSDDGVAIECELYDLPDKLIATLAALEPPGWQRAPLRLEDGREVEAFVGDQALRARGVDVSEHGSWPAYTARREETLSDERLH